MVLKPHGFTLIELMIGVALLAILLMVGVPSFSAWVQNSQIRTAAESIQNGIQLSRAEAVRRNMVVRFQLMSSVDNGCAQDQNGKNWVISLDDASGECGGKKINDGFLLSDPVNNPFPRIIQLYSGADTAKNAEVSSDQSTISFNGLGRQVSVVLSGGGSTLSPPAEVKINIANSHGGACATSANPENPMRCLRVVISPAGKVRMCDPALGANDAQSCGGGA